ncbi:MAG TPA: hypothetical protein PKG93_00375 [Bacilli bacterium]|nr:hypothetical protein [Bacilli bacterium]
MEIKEFRKKCIVQCDRAYLDKLFGAIMGSKSPYDTEIRDLVNYREDSVTSYDKLAIANFVYNMVPKMIRSIDRSQLGNYTGKENIQKSISKSVMHKNTFVLDSNTLFPNVPEFIDREPIEHELVLNFKDYNSALKACENLFNDMVEAKIPFNLVLMNPIRKGTNLTDGYSYRLFVDTSSACLDRTINLISSKIVNNKMYDMELRAPSMAYANVDNQLGYSSVGEKGDILSKISNVISKSVDNDIKTYDDRHKDVVLDLLPNWTSRIESLNKIKQVDAGAFDQIIGHVGIYIGQTDLTLHDLFMLADVNKSLIHTYGEDLDIENLDKAKEEIPENKKASPFTAKPDMGNTVAEEDSSLELNDKEKADLLDNIKDDNSELKPESIESENDKEGSDIDTPIEDIDLAKPEVEDSTEEENTKLDNHEIEEPYLSELSKEDKKEEVDEEVKVEGPLLKTNPMTKKDIYDLLNGIPLSGSSADKKSYAQELDDNSVIGKPDNAQENMTNVSNYATLDNPAQSLDNNAVIGKPDDLAPQAPVSLSDMDKVAEELDSNTKIGVADLQSEAHKSVDEALLGKDTEEEKSNDDNKIKVVNKRPRRNLLNKVVNRLFGKGNAVPTRTTEDRDVENPKLLNLGDLPDEVVDKKVEENLHTSKDYEDEEKNSTTPVVPDAPKHVEQTEGAQDEEVVNKVLTNVDNSSNYSTESINIKPVGIDTSVINALTSEEIRSVIIPKKEIDPKLRLQYETLCSNYNNVNVVAGNGKTESLVDFLIDNDTLSKIPLDSVVVNSDDEEMSGKDFILQDLIPSISANTADNVLTTDEVINRHVKRISTRKDEEEIAKEPEKHTGFLRRLFH